MRQSISFEKVESLILRVYVVISLLIHAAHLLVEQFRNFMNW
jgi:hypothetical protein